MDTARDAEIREHGCSCSGDCPKGVETALLSPLYSPPSREWVGLSHSLPTAPKAAVPLGHKGTHSCQMLLEAGQRGLQRAKGPAQDHLVLLCCLFPYLFILNCSCYQSRAL